MTQKIKAENSHSLKIATLYRFVYGAFLVAGRKLAKDTYYIGSWYGNDTIWRTVVDLNYIVKYADQQGHLQDTPQRKLLHLGDMIIAGERNGPVSPEPKKLGVILVSEDAAAFDMIVCKIMGFDPKKIPLIHAIHKMNPVEINVCNSSSSKTIFNEEKPFKPHDAWVKALKG